MKTMIAIIAAGVAATACSGGNKDAKSGTDTLSTAARPDSTRQAAQPSAATAQKVGTTDGLKTPESVKYDAERDLFYISNINGNPSQKDGNGFIVVVKADSVAATPAMLAQGGKNGVTLNAPKGLALVGDTLWVADIDAVRGFNRKTGAPIATVDLSRFGAKFLNDIAVGPDGALYITDTGILFDAKGGMTHPGPDRIFKIAGRTPTVAIQGDTLGRPNGITWDSTNARFIVVCFGTKNVLSWKIGDKNPASLASGPGQFDGVEILGDGRVLVSSWADSSVAIFSKDIGGAHASVARLITNVPAPADIGVDSRRNRVAVPLFNGDRVEYYQLR
jgi:sugar lactone lactonase YvrE